MSKSRGTGFPVSGLKREKKPYFSPTLVELNATAAKTKLKEMGDPQDAAVQKMLSMTEQPVKKTGQDS